LGLYVTNPAVLSIFSSGKFTGIVVDSGESLTQFAPVFDGCLLSNSIL
jgi:actin-related protein